MAWLPTSNTPLQYMDENGDPYSGAVLKFYAAGTSTNISVATAQTGTPTVTSVALNSDGYPEVSSNTVIIFVDQDFKVALYPTQAAADSNTGALWTIDNIDPFAVLTLPTNLTDINALTPADGTIIVGDGTEWVAETGSTARTSIGLGSGDSPAFTNVTLSGLTTGHVVLANSAGALTALDVTAKGSLIVGDGAGAPTTLTAGTNGHVLTLDSGESKGVKWAAPAVTTIERVARTSNTILGVSDSGDFFDVTSGTFTQTLSAASTLGANWFVYYRNSGTGVVTIDPDSSETIDGSATYIIGPGEAAIIQCNGTAFYVPVKYTQGNSYIIVTTGNGHGAVNTKIRRFTTTLASSGSAITYADSANDGGSFTVVQPGLYEISYVDGGTGATTLYTHGVSINSAQLTTDVDSITAANRIGALASYGNAGGGCFTRTARLSAGDVIRAHNGSTTGNLPAATAPFSTQFSITKVG